MKTQVWAPVEGYPNYEVSTWGVVRSLRTGLKLKARPTVKGYLRVTLSREGVLKEVYIHQLVAQTFYNDWTPGTRIRFVNGDKTDNSIWNLYLTKNDPVVDRPSAREGWGKRVRIIETGQVFRTVRDCARFIGGDYSSVYRVLEGKRRTHLGFTFEYLEE